MSGPDREAQDPFGAPPPAGTVGHLLDRSCRVLALGGGLLLVGLLAMTVASIVGRFLFGLPVPGDFELMQTGCAVAVFAFLPHAQLHGHNVVVDFFTRDAPHPVRPLLDALGGTLFGLVALLLVWRMALGGLDLLAYGETTMILGMPLWWGFVPILLSAGLLAVVCAHTVWRDLRKALR